MKLSRSLLALTFAVSLLGVTSLRAAPASEKPKDAPADHCKPAEGAKSCETSADSCCGGQKAKGKKDGQKG